MRCFWENVQKQILALDPPVKIFPEYDTSLKCALLPSTIMQKTRNFKWPLLEEMSKKQFLTLNPP